ncbi:MAG: twin-arginine translocase subunit TatC, partial [Pirellulales bacterium]|nr:twin-arginine translocase subunit TatC [Pirellulales bacterium]
MPARRPDEDLFADSTMTFGQHLEELRGCLFRSVVALVLASVVGLMPFAGGNLVALIKRPLESALSDYYEIQATDLAKQKLEAMRAKGEVLPDDPAKIANFVRETHLLPQQVFVDPDEVVNQLRQHDPGRFGNLAPAASDKSAKPSGEPAADGPDASAKPPVEKNMIPLFLWRPTEEDTRMRAKSLSPHEAFMIYVKASLFLGIVLASPYVFYQIWSFVAAGLYPHEKHYVHVFLPFSLGLFLAGAATAFFFVFEPVLTFLFSFNRSMGIDI